MSAVFRLHTTNYTIEFTDDEYGYLLDHYSPGMFEFKQGGIVEDGMFHEGSNLTDYRISDVEETITVNIRGVSTDEVYQLEGDLYRAIQEALRDEVSGLGQPPYLEVKGLCEDCERYAIIRKITYTRNEDMFGQSLLNSPPFLHQVEITITRGMWTRHPPVRATETVYTARNREDIVPITAGRTYAGRNFGMVDTSGNFESAFRPIAFGNHDIPFNLTHVFFNDISVPSFSANLLDATYPAVFMPTAAVVGDFIFVGIQNTTDLYHFQNVVLPLSANAPCTVTLEYNWSGNVTSMTNSVMNLTTQEQFFVLSWSSTMATVGTATINGVTARWARFRIAALSVPGTQINITRRPYVANWPDFQISGKHMPYPLGSLLARLYNRSFDYNLMLAGFSLSRSATFTPYIHLGDVRNAGVEFVNGSPSSTFVTANYAPTGRALQLPPSISDAARIYYNIGSVIPPGKYRVFIRGSGDAGNASRPFSIRIYNRSRLLLSRIPTFNLADNEVWSAGLPTRGTGTAGNAIALCMVELGTIQVDPPVVAGFSSAQELTVDIRNQAASPVLLVDLIFMPIDEFFVELQNNTEWFTEGVAPAIIYNNHMIDQRDERIKEAGTESVIASNNPVVIPAPYGGKDDTMRIYGLTYDTMRIYSTNTVTPSTFSVFPNDMQNYFGYSIEHQQLTVNPRYISGAECITEEEIEEQESGGGEGGPPTPGPFEP